MRLVNEIPKKEVVNTVRILANMSAIYIRQQRQFEHEVNKEWARITGAAFKQAARIAGRMLK